MVSLYYCFCRAMAFLQKTPFFPFPLSLSTESRIVDKAPFSPMSGQVFAMVMKINLDCNACCRKMKRVLLKMKEIETHIVDKQHCRVIVCGRFVPSDVAIKIRKKMNRRVEILEIEELLSNANEQREQMPQAAPDHAVSQPA